MRLFGQSLSEVLCIKATRLLNLVKDSVWFIECLDVTNLLQTLAEEGGKVTFFGKAEVKIGSGEEATTYQVSYRIDVDNLAESGKGKDTFKIQTDSGYVAARVLEGGNLQVYSQ